MWFIHSIRQTSSPELVLLNVSYLYLSFLSGCGYFGCSGGNAGSDDGDLAHCSMGTLRSQQPSVITILVGIVQMTGNGPTDIGSHLLAVPVSLFYA